MDWDAHGFAGFDYSLECSWTFYAGDLNPVMGAIRETQGGGREIVRVSGGQVELREDSMREFHNLVAKPFAV
jgi:hypothetical protein